jgi:hypothetical protein
LAGFLIDRPQRKKGREAKPETLAGGISLQPYALDGFCVTKLLLGYDEIVRNVAMAAKFFKRRPYSEARRRRLLSTSKSTICLNPLRPSLTELRQEQSVGQGRTSSPGSSGIRGVERNVESASYRFPGVVVGSNPSLTAFNSMLPLVSPPTLHPKSLHDNCPQQIESNSVARLHSDTWMHLTSSTIKVSLVCHYSRVKTREIE